MENVKRVYLWLVGGLMLIFSSCLGGDEDDAGWSSSNCQIKSFSLKNDSIPKLSSVKFTIDQVNGLIYNKDSMAYGTVIDKKVICTVAYEVGALSVEVYQDATGDSAYWNGSDSLDFSSFVRFDVASIDGKAIKRYTAKLNVHQQLPDSMTWTLLESSLLGKTVQDQKVIAHDGSYWMYTKNQDVYELYRSSNMTDWTKSNLNGLTGKTFILSQLVSYEGFLFLPTTEGALYQSANGMDWTAPDSIPEVKAILGVVYESSQLRRPSALSAIIRENGKWYYAAMNKGFQWKTGNEISTAFPVTGFGHVSHEVMYYQRLVVVAGKNNGNQLSNAAWETMDGLQWVQLTDDQVTSFDKREGIALTLYDDDFYLFGGIDASNVARKDIYRSENKGVTWVLVDSLMTFPEAYKARGYSSLLVDDNHYIFLFGGKENVSANMLDELWSGRINRLGFKD